MELKKVIEIIKNNKDCIRPKYSDCGFDVYKDGNNIAICIKTSFKNPMYFHKDKIIKLFDAVDVAFIDDGADIPFWNIEIAG